jgi:hypothetical protein
VKHARPRIAHHGLDLVSHGRLEAMDRTLGASRLSLLEWALHKTLIGIDQELAALSAWSVTSMLAATVEIDHDRHGLAFPGYSGMSLVHGKHILPQKQTPIHKIEQKDSLQIKSSHMPSDISTPAHPQCSQRTPGCRPLYSGVESRQTQCQRGNRGSSGGLVVFQIEAESGWHDVPAALVSDNASVEVGG